MERCIICLGSNTDGESHLLHARESISSAFGNVRWGKTVLTGAEGTACPLPYYNQAAVFDTKWEADRVRAFFKSLEREHGRTSLSKSSGIIPLDIDLLVYGGTTLKPGDMEKSYVRQALESLG